MPTFGSRLVNVADAGAQSLTTVLEGTSDIRAVGALNATRLASLIEAQLQSLSGPSPALQGGVLYFPKGLYPLSTPTHIPGWSQTPDNPTARGANPFGASVVIPKTVTVWFAPGAILALDAGCVLDILGDIVAECIQIFDTHRGGFVTLSPTLEAADAEWWGAVADSPGSNQQALQAAIDSCIHLRAAIIPRPELYSVVPILRSPVTLRLNNSYPLNGSLTIDLRGVGLTPVFSDGPEHRLRIITRAILRAHGLPENDTRVIYQTTGGGRIEGSTLVSRAANAHLRYANPRTHPDEAILQCIETTGLTVVGVGFAVEHDDGPCCLSMEVSPTVIGRSIAHLAAFEDCSFFSHGQRVMRLGNLPVFLPDINGFLAVSVEDRLLGSGDLSMLVFRGCQIEHRDALGRTSESVYYRAGNTIPLSFISCDFRGDVSTFVRPVQGGAVLSGCTFDNRRPYVPPPPSTNVGFEPPTGSDVYLSSEYPDQLIRDPSTNNVISVTYRGANGHPGVCMVHCQSSSDVLIATVETHPLNFLSTLMGPVYLLHNLQRWATFRAPASIIWGLRGDPLGPELPNQPPRLVRTSMLVVAGSTLRTQPTMSLGACQSIWIANRVHDGYTDQAQPFTQYLDRSRDERTGQVWTKLQLTSPLNHWWVVARRQSTMMLVLLMMACVMACSSGRQGSTADAASDLGMMEEDVTSALDAGAPDIAPSDLGPEDTGVDVGNDTGPDVLRITWERGDFSTLPAPQSECARETHTRPGDDSIAPPRPVLPQSVSRSSSARVRFRWILPAGVEGARIEICRDRCCTQVVRTVDVARGTDHQLVEPLGFGVHFWRLFGKVGERVGSRPSATWEFRSPRVSSEASESYDTLRDVDGDGVDDAVYLNLETNCLRWQASTGQVQSQPCLSRYLENIAWGDFDGDGLGDVVATGAPPDSAGTNLIVFRWRGGQMSRTDITPVVREQAGRLYVSIGKGSADYNGDGYSDVAVNVSNNQGGILQQRIAVYLGSADGLQAQPQYWLDSPTGGRAFAVPLPDMAGDGFGGLMYYYETRPGVYRMIWVRGILSGYALDMNDVIPFLQRGLSVDLGSDLSGDGYPDLILDYLGAAHVSSSNQVGALSLSGQMSVLHIDVEDYRGASGSLNGSWIVADADGSGSLRTYLSSNLVFCSIQAPDCYDASRNQFAFVPQMFPRIAGPVQLPLIPLPLGAGIGTPNSLAFTAGEFVGDINGDGADDILRGNITAGTLHTCLVTTARPSGYSCL